MKTYISHLFEDADMLEILEQDETGHVGIEMIDFCVGMYLDDWRSTMASYRGRMGSVLTERPLSVHGPFLDLQPMSWDCLARQAARTRFEQSFEAAMTIGAERIVYHTCFMPYAMEIGWAERMIDFWREFLEDKDPALEVHMENVFDPHYRGSVQIAQTICKEYPQFSLCLDLGHAHCYGEEPVEEWMEAFAPLARHYHVHDNLGDVDAHLALGDGNMNMDLLLGTILRENTCGGCTIENNTKETTVKSLRVLKEKGILR